MKKKIVIWGNDENDKKILVALELKSEDNKVVIHTFNEESATEAFYNQMIDEWRLGKEVAFPEGYTTLERPLSMTEDLLPENIKVQRGDIINRAKTEWHFSVLSSKLYDLYKSELEEMKDRIDRLVDFDGGIWEELKSFWGKLSEQSRERNLYREHAQKLKDQSNALFTQLKELRTKANKELEKASKERASVIQTKLDTINEKIEKGLGLNPIFEELKKLQSEFRSQTFSRGDKNKLWKKIDEAFKVVKEKKFGKPSQVTEGRMSRLERRYQGLMDAIDKMERSIGRDQKDIEFQTRRAGETDGQLEMQIRQAKVQMVEGRIESKREKLKEMMTTKVDLEKRLEKETERKEKMKEKKEIAAKKNEIKEKIAKEISEKASEVDEAKLKAAADAVKKPRPPKKETLMGAVMAVAGDAIEDMVDTVKAVGSVVGDKIEDKVESLELDKKMDTVKEKLADVKEEIKEEVGEMKEKFEDIKEEAGEKLAEVKEEVKEEMGEMKEKVQDIKEEAGEKLAEVKQEVKEEVGEMKEKVEEVKEKQAADSEEGSLAKKGGFLAAAAAIGGAIVNEITEKVEDIKEEVTEKVEEIKTNLTDSTSSAMDESVDEVANRVGIDNAGSSEEE